MAMRLHELEHARHRLIASVSHELRTPLTVIRGHAYTLGRGEGDERRRQKFELIDAEVERLARMIDDLLAAATLRVAPVKLALGDTSLRQLLTEAVARFQLTAHRSGVDIVVDSLPHTCNVRIDSCRIEQVVANLLANAIAHAPTGSKVRVSVEIHGRHVRLAIANGGDPIPPELLPHIFEPFVQGAQSTGSVGLGLAIACGLVKAHGAHLNVRSGASETRFWFDLPLEGAPSVPARPSGVRAELGWVAT
jgi:two-component system OmpR family sensor kinase